MLISSSDPEPKVVEQYDFTLRGGIVFPITIDPSAGDTIDFQDAQVRAWKAPRVGQNDPTVGLPGEEIVIYRQWLLAYQHRSVEVVPAYHEFTPSFDRKQTIQ